MPVMEPPPSSSSYVTEPLLISKKAVRARPLFDPPIVKRAIGDSFTKLHPRLMMKNPVMFVVEVGAAMTTLEICKDLAMGHNIGFTLQISIWLWFTVLFANFAEAMAEGRGKAQADTLRKTKTETMAKRLKNGKKYETVAAALLRRGDVVLVERGDIIPGDGDVIEGIASVDESAITGESAPVIRESGGDRSAVTGGTRVLSDQIKVQITSNPGETFLDRMIALVEGAERQKTPNEIALNIVIAGLTFIFLLAVVSLYPFAQYSVQSAGSGAAPSVTVLISLLVCLIPTTIGGLLSAIGIAGMDRVMQHNVLAMSGKAVEAAGDVNTLLLDKTGTITLGNRQAVEFIRIGNATEGELADAAQLSSLADETPEGRSIVVLAKEKYAYRGREVADHEAHFIPFTAQTRMSGVDIDGRRIRKGATESVVEFVQEQGGTIPPELTETTQRISRSGGTPLVVADRDRVLGVIHLKDVVKGGMRERFEQLRRIGIRTVMITGDNPLTAAAIAAEAGVDDFLAQATPKDKMDLIKKEQAGGRLVAMTGDGTNDAPALAQADVGLAMNTGTMAAKEAGNMVDLDSNPTKLIEVVAIGKQLLMTRGSLTTFSIANDVAKYFAILPAMFMTTYPSLEKLNIMYLRNPQSAVLAAVIFNALIIIALIPLALRGVAYKPLSAGALLRRNLLIYGVGGVIAPFPGIWVIDRILGLLHLA
ncbi:MAG TPA: potassium-transporting ATPase subunit KdpB [Bryobacteraceae bacterium]|jgi:potassium-transporting ATPase ATP-binding subunit|nr:potassium-transporting ATPase subunit KdpB [Bryobacteraceae bacterium]